ncbi:MAG: FAD-dependent oxidoreductase [Bacillota bacterium]
MIEKELVIIGAGPAGLSAAIEASKRNVDVLLIDENHKAGGQLFKQIHKFFGSDLHNAGVRGIDIGKELIKKSKDLGVEVWLNSVVIGVFSNKKIAVEKNEIGLQTVLAKKIVIATGAAEKVINFEGWTLPGVMGAGAAQTMTNLHRVLPGRRIMMIGSGNVGLIVSYQLIQAGAKIVGLVDAASEVGGYGVHSAKIERAGVPIYLKHTILKAKGTKGKGVTGAVIAEVNKDWKPIKGTEKEFDVDVIAIAAGLKTLSELANMANCERTYISELGGWVPLHNENMESTQKGIYVVGDTAGVEEANTALEEGRLAGIDVAEKLGKSSLSESEKNKEQINTRVKGLRLGPFGEGRLKAKKKLIKEYYKNMKNKSQSTDFTSEPKVVIECNQEIPCNPCESACKFGAITIGEPITNKPQLDKEKCIGCGLCLPECPGLAIFLLDKNYNRKDGTVAFPYEFPDLPQEGEIVDALNRKGEFLCKAKVLKVKQLESFDKTPIVTIIVPQKYVGQARNLRPKGADQDER